MESWLNKVGLIGYGYWGKILYEKLKMFCDVRFICKSEDDYMFHPLLEELEEVDWVFVATPDDTHYRIVEDCLSLGKNVFCEKPLTPTYKKSKKLYKIAKQNNVKLYVDDVFNYRDETNELLNRYSHNPSHIKSIWKKYGRTDYRDYTPASFYNLMYHDLYLLHPFLRRKKIKSLNVFEKNNCLHFEVMFGGVKVEFLYDRKSKNETKHSVLDVDFTKHTNDALDKMIKKVLNGDVDYKLNKEQSLFVSKTIDEFKRKIYKNVSIVGGGIFGCTTAWKLAKEGYDVTLYEKNDDIISQASNINQYRLHKGYHYPRSIDTAKSSIQGENTFLQEYGEAIVNGDVEHYYCIAKNDSLVTSSEYKKFLDKINLPYEEKKLDFLHENVVSLVVGVDELLFNPNKLKNICWSKLKKHNVNVVLNSNYDMSDSDDDYVINSTYANLNEILPEDKQKDYQFELCEKPVLKLPEQYKNKSVVIMDGPFMCIDPLGDSDLHVMGNVVHAIHSTNVGKFPEYDKKFDKLLNKGIVKNPSITNINKFIESAKMFFKDIENSEHIGSMFTFRTVLPNRDKDDARPTLVEKQTDNILNVFSGKIGTCVNAAKEVLDEIR
jgi:GR25 family glycosyltransferase involved in LPS biosynthesis